MGGRIRGRRRRRIQEESYFKKKYERCKRRYEDVKDKYEKLGVELEDEEESGISDENAVRIMLMLALMNQKIDAIMDAMNIVMDISKPRGTTTAEATNLQNKILK